MDEKEVFQIILQAKNEAQAVFQQVAADVRAMVSEIQQQTRLAEASFQQFGEQTRLLHATVGELASQTNMMFSGVASAAAAAAPRAVSAWEQAMTRLKTSSASVGASLNSVFNPLGISKGLVLDAGIVDAIKTAGDFQQSMLKTQALTEATQADIDMWSPAIRRMSENTSVGANQLGEAMFFIASSGYHAADALTVLDSVQKAAATGLGDLGQVANLVVSAMNAYGLGADQAITITDKLQKTIVEGHIDPAQLVPALGRTLPIAASLNIPIEEVLAMIASDTRMGNSPSVAATGVRTMLTSLLRPTARAKETLIGLGINPDTIPDDIKGDGGLSGFLTEIFQRSHGDTRVLNNIFGNQRSASVALALAKGGGDESGTGAIYAHVENEIAHNSAGTTENAFRITQQGFTKQLERFGNVFQEGARSLGSQLIPGLTMSLQGLSGALSFVVDGLSRLTGGLNQSVVPGMALASVLGLYLAVQTVRAGAAVIQFGVQLGQMASALRALAGLSAVSWGAILGPLAIAVGAIALVYVVWSNNLFGIQERVADFVQFIRDHWLNVLAFFIPVIHIVELLQAAWNANFLGIRDTITNIVETIKGAIGGFLDWLAGHHLGVDPNWREQWKDFGQGVADGVGKAGDAVSSAVDNVGKTKDDIGKKISDAFTPTQNDPNAPGGSPDKTPKLPEDFDPFANASNPLDMEIIGLGPAAISGLQGLAQDKMGIAQAADDLKAAQEAQSQLQFEAEQRKNEFDLSEIDNQKAMLGLKQQQADLDAAMIGPKAQQRDLEQQIKNAAHERLMLDFEQRDLQLQDASFSTNADIKRIQQQISQQQLQMEATRSPSQAGALKNSIDALKQKENALKISLFPNDSAQLENTIGKDRQGLDNKLEALPAQKALADLQPTLTALDAQKASLADQTALLQHQMDVKKAAFDADELGHQAEMIRSKETITGIQLHQAELKKVYDQQVQNWLMQQTLDGHISRGDATNILKKLGLNETETAKAQDLIDQLDKLQKQASGAPSATTAGVPVGGAQGTNAKEDRGAQPVVQIDIHNPVVSSPDAMNTQLETFKQGLRQAVAQGIAMPAGSSRSA